MSTWRSGTRVPKAARLLAPLLLGAGVSAGLDRMGRTGAIFERLAAGGEPGLAARVRKDGRAVFERGYGVRDLRTRTRIDARTDFRLASVTKQLTAMAVMLLVREGKVGYDDRLTDLLPGFPAYGKAITVRNLLSHTSGLPDYEELMDAAQRGGPPIWTEGHQIRDEEVIALLARQTQGRFAPGTSWSYSNSGYVVLGAIVARVSGSGFGDFLQARIFAPLHMDHTLAYQKGRNDVTDRAYGHTKEGDAFRETDQSATSATLGDGGVYSNLEDLAKWDEALERHTLLSETEMQPALTPARLIDGSEPRWPREPGGDNLHPRAPVSYGFGWFLDPYHSRRRMWHHGETMGFRSVIERFPADRLTVVLLCNRTDLDPQELALKVADLYVPPGAGPTP
jgi:CubicO group peptidase (beta-lactamase class C family)